jgi:hypothetical protein
MLTGFLGSCNLNLAGDQSNTSIWDSCLDRGLYTLAYRRCTCFCTFCNNSFSQEQAFNRCDTTPYYNTQTAGSSPQSNVGWVTTGLRNDGHPFMWNLIPNPSSPGGTVTIYVSSPRSLIKSTPIYGYEMSQMSTSSTTWSLNAVVSSGGFFGGWRVNSAGGVQASLNASFSPGYQTSYTSKGVTQHYKNIYQFYANGTFF